MTTLEALSQVEEPVTEPTYTFCPTCGEPIETDVLHPHLIACDGSIVVPAGSAREVAVEFRDDGSHSIYDRAERRSDKILRDDGSDR